MSVSTWMPEERRGGRAARWLLAVLAVLAFGAFASTASADPLVLSPESGDTADAVYGPEGPNMFTTNVPYVAWRGEQIRAVKCDSTLSDGDGNLRDGVYTDIIVEEWTNTRDPAIEQGTVTFFRDTSNPTDRQWCVRFDAVSLQDGLARIKLVVSDRSHNPIMKHQFLMIWLSLQDTTIDEVGANDPTGGPVGSRGEVGDPAGDGNLTAGGRDGRVQVLVRGSFPHPFGPGGRFILPNDWATIAAALAVDNDPLNDPDTLRWDIHDDTGKGVNHINGGVCAAIDQNSSLFDDVDNCWLTRASNELGPFSNVFKQGVKGAGPFDPARPATLLGNGVVDAGDAPMPAARVDVSIAPNSGGVAIDGVGALEKADKAVAYSRDGNGFSPRSPHNLYAPYYKQYIPATSAPGPDSSGIDGPQVGNSFPGFLVDGLYDNWDIAAVLRSNPWADSTCNKYVDFGASLDDGWYPKDTPRALPYGPQKVAVYTDEHGEAQVEYEPYAEGFYYDSLPVIHNANRGCDLQGIDVLGTSDITATAMYPYQPVSDAPKTSAALHKVVHSQFDKSMSYWPKGEGAANQNARIAVVHGNDVDGTPFAHELVCFYVAEQADGVRGFVGDVGPAGAKVHIGGDTVRNTVQGADVCRRLDENGNAAIEVFNSDPQMINVIAEFANEGLLRSIDLDFATPGSHSGTPPVITPGDDPCRRAGQWTGCQHDGPGTKPPSAAVLAETAGTQAATHLTRSVKKAKKAKKGVAVARIALRNGKHVLFVRVRSTRKHERISVRIGKRSLRRTIATNHLVRVANVPEGVVVTVTVTG